MGGRLSLGSREIVIWGDGQTRVSGFQQGDCDLGSRETGRGGEAERRV